MILHLWTYQKNLDMSTIIYQDALKDFYASPVSGWEQEGNRYINSNPTIIDMYRKENGLAIEKFEFWLPHCIVNGNKVDVKLVAESFGISRVVKRAAVFFISEYAFTYPLLMKSKVEKESKLTFALHTPLKLFDILRFLKHVFSVLEYG